MEIRFTTEGESIIAKQEKALQQCESSCAVFSSLDDYFNVYEIRRASSCCASVYDFDMRDLEMFVDGCEDESTEKNAVE